LIRTLTRSYEQGEYKYDLKYALRMCTKHNKRKACVYIYSAMGLYEQAVDEALKDDIELAKANADKPEDDDPLRKKLWLKIARHLVEQKKDFKKAMDLLRQCDLLKIEDILPFFPNFVKIDDFKEEICNSLTDYNRHINNLKNEMSDATKSADLIRLDIRNLRHKYGIVYENQRCELCGFMVLTRQFYLYPCGHAYHSDCLAMEMAKHLPPHLQSTLSSLLFQIQSASDSVPASKHSGSIEELGTSVVVPQLTSIEQKKAELDKLIASECIQCGEIMISTINQPFISPDEKDVISSWEC